MQIFIKRFWGFDPKRIPLITFSKEVFRDKLLKQANVGDLLVFVATKDDNAQKEDQGKLLGMVEIGTRAINTLDIVPLENLPKSLRDGNKPRFPSAIPMLRAWRFTTTPYLTDLFDQLPQNARIEAILLDDAKKHIILSLPKEEVLLPETEAIQKERVVAERKLLMPSKGIAPSYGERNFTVENKDFGCVYAFRFGKRNIWKVGTSYNPEQRIEHLNKNIPYESIGEKWEYYAKQKFSSQSQAFNIEQTAMTELEKYSIGGEMFACEENIFNTAWKKVVVGFFMSETT